MPNAAETVHAYFAAIRARDADTLRALFTADAQLVTLTGTYDGADAIASFYRDLVFSIADVWPDPAELIVDGARIAVEIRLRMGGNTTLVADVFTMSAAGDRIERVAIFPGPAVS